MHVRFVGTTDLGPVLSIAVVVDVMRAFTTAAHALDRGADAVILAGSHQEITQLKVRQPGIIAVTDGPPRTGFDAVNSPATIARLDLTGRTLAMKTTAGTTGALAARHADLLLCASFVVADATAHLLRGGVAVPHRSGHHRVPQFAQQRSPVLRVRRPQLPHQAADTGQRRAAQRLVRGSYGGSGSMLSRIMLVSAPLNRFTASGSTPITRASSATPNSTLPPAPGRERRDGLEYPPLGTRPGLAPPA